MLAPNFKTAAELGLTELQHKALIKVLGQLERYEIREGSTADSNAFNMRSWNSCLCYWANKAALDLDYRTRQLAFPYQASDTGPARALFMRMSWARA